jgi:hypothetical protein
MKNGKMVIQRFCRYNGLFTAWLSETLIETKNLITG